MRAVVQRVNYARLTVDGEIVSHIGRGILVLLGAQTGDGEKDIDYIVKKSASLRIFSDDEGKMNLSVKDVGGEIMVVSQFTLLGDARKGNRPSFVLAGEHENSKKLYEEAVNRFNKTEIPVKTGIFGADMKIAFENDGPVTILLDSRKAF